MDGVPVGGPSTINGILYQMLWALHRVGSLAMRNSTVDETSGELTEATLILEPAEGGDQREEIGGRRIVEQLKARSDGRAWSLQEVVADVLPDLYRAVDLSQPNTVYRFVTEGRRGEWAQAETFFRSLKGRTPNGDILKSLDDTNEIGFRRVTGRADSDRQPFWDAGPYSERSLFECIVTHLRSRKEVAAEGIEGVRKKLWHLLGHFEFVPGNTARSIQKLVDAWLRAVVPAIEDLAHCRDALLLDLARQATVGGARIVASEFFADHKLDATPLSDWMELSHKGRERFEGMLELRRTDLSEDARPGFADLTFGRWRDNGPILVLLGDSGTGKTWLGTALLGRATREQEIPLLVDARGDAQRDQDIASRQFWQDIVGHDNALPFARIRQRLTQEAKIHEDRNIALMIDRVDDHTEARQLTEMPWEDWGVRIVITCLPNVADTIRSASREDRCTLVEVPDFTLEELQTYLESTLGDRWATIPADVRDTLRRPLFARLYRDLGGPAAWRPTCEYELVEKFWQRLFEGEQGNYPLDAENLWRAAFSSARSAPYPWSVEQLCGASRDDGCVGRLIKIGWLRSRSPGSYEVWHNRLLNWAVAEGIVSEVCANRITETDACELLRQLQMPTAGSQTLFLGYVPMDVVWIALDSRYCMEEFVAKILRALEGQLLSLDEFYGRLLPTLGTRVIPVLFTRLREAAEEGNFFLARPIANAVIRTGAQDAPSRASGLLDQDSPWVQRSGTMVLGGAPTPEALDRLWELHCRGEADPHPFLSEHEPRFAIHEDSFRALRACVRLDPDWLERKIARADPTTEPVHDLAYLVAGLDDGGVMWHRCKSQLRAKVPTSKERSLASNIAAYRDRDEVEWLLERVSRGDDLVGPTALRALIRIDKRLALEHLDRLPERELYFTRGWHLAELLLRLPDETNAHLLDRLRQHAKPWEFAHVFQGHENSMSVLILEFLLDALEPLLEPGIDKPVEDRQIGAIMLSFQSLAKINRAELLECFRHRRGTALEQKLANWLLMQGPQQGLCTQHEKCDGLAVLAMIGGEGFTTVVNDWLQRGDYHGRLHAIDLATRNPNSQTLDLLAERALSDEVRDNFPVEQGHAALALAALGQWQDVIRYIVRWGLKCLREVAQHHREIDRLDDEVMMPALEKARSGASLDTGVIEALGFGHRAEFADVVRQTLRSADPESDTAHACVLALERFRDDSATAVPLLVEQLAVPSHRHSARFALLVNGTDAALEALLDYIKRDYDHPTALNLLSDERTRARVVPLVKEELCAVDELGSVGRLRLLLDWVKDDTVVDELLSDERVREYVRETALSQEGGVWFVGSKATAIRTLARFDPDAAYAAAQAALQNEEGRDREMYPYLMAAIDPHRAVHDLVEHAAREHRTAVRWAIGRTLSGVDCREAVQRLLDSARSDKRAAACEFCGFLGDSPWAAEGLHAALEDSPNRVAHAAQEALRRIDDHRNACRLVEAIGAEESHSHRWVLLDALIASADVGDELQPGPTWVRDAAKNVPLLMRMHLEKQIRERRRTVRDQTQQQDRRSD